MFTNEEIYLMSCMELVAVTSRSFSRNSNLRQHLQERFSHVRFNEDGIRLTHEALVQFLGGASRAIIGLEVIDDALLDRLPHLKAICKMGTGIDKVDVDALKRRKIVFSATPGLNKRSVSELVLGLIFTLLRHLQTINMFVKQGRWKQPVGKLLSNKTVGIIGFGAVGQDLVKLLSVFNCQCLVFDMRTHDDCPPNVLRVNLETLLNESDIISLHIPLLPENVHFVGEHEFAQMKKGAILINTARGGLIDEEALYRVLRNGHLSAAALDVFEHEPNISKKLLKLDNFFATCHIGGSTEEAIEAMGKMAIEQLLRMKIENSKGEN